MTNTFSITIIKMFIIKINIIKGDTATTKILTKECNKMRVYIAKDYIVLRKYSTYSSYLQQTS